MKPFLDSLAKEGNKNARNYAKLDQFHIATHTETKCDITMYIPPRFAEV